MSMFTVQPHTFPNSIQRLCPDVLTEIFIFCLRDVSKESWDVDRITSWKAPLLLCAVCSSWRSLAISTPRLWQTLHLRFYGSGHPSSLINTESFIRTWLDRSRALPLYIRAVFGPVNKSDQATKCRLILEILCQEASRWGSFEMRADEIWAPGTFPHFGVLPMLHTFDILIPPIYGIPFTAAPHLKRLRLGSLPTLTSISAITWDQLVELDIEKSQTIPMAVGVIRRCPRLESLFLTVTVGDEDGDSSLTFRSITQHDTLRRLRLECMRLYINAVTDRLTLPALTDLSLKAHRSISDVEANFCGSQLVDFFTRSNCRLLEFELKSFYGFGQGELLKCLSHPSCQTLTRLVVHQSRGEDWSRMLDRELLIRLTYSDTDDDVPLCPKLSHLESTYCYCSDEFLSLGRMIQSRCFGRAPVRSLQLRTRWDISGAEYNLLKSESNGLQFQYSYKGY